MKGSVGILNVGAGDTKLVFDRTNPAECIRAGRIVKDMLRRGYALLVEVEPGRFQRVREFREDVCEYVIADFDPVEAEQADREEEQGEAERDGQEQTIDAASNSEARAAGPAKRGRRTRTIPASEARAVAISRSAGG